MNVAKRIATNTFSIMGAEIATKILSALAIIYLARVLTPKDFGVLSFAVAIISYFIVLTDWGLTIVGARSIARDHTAAAQYLGSIVTLRLVAGLIALLLVGIFLMLSPIPRRTKFVVLLFGLTIVPTALRIDWVFQGIEQMGAIAWGRILHRGIYALSIFLVIRNTAHLLYIPFLETIALVAGVVYLFHRYVSQFGPLRIALAPRAWGVLLRQAIPIGLTAICAAIIYRLDIVMLGFLRSAEEVGYYSAAYSLTWLLLGLCGAYFSAIFPAASSFYHSSKERFLELLAQSYRWICILFLPIAVGVNFMARPIMRFLYGDQYLLGVVALHVLIWVLVLILINSVFAYGLLASDRQNRYLGILVVQMVTNVVLNVIFIPWWGIWGAALATLAAEAVGLPMYYYVLQDVVAVPLVRMGLKPALAAGAMGAFFFIPLPVHRFAMLLGGVGIYGFSLLLMGAITWEDLQRLRRYAVAHSRGLLYRVE